LVLKGERDVQQLIFSRQSHTL